MAEVDPDARKEAHDAFREAVNMGVTELRRWLDTEESQSVGVTSGGAAKSGTEGGESKGHESGRRIVDLLQRDLGDLGEDDVAQMRRVAGYVHRHLAQGPPKEDVEHSRWRYSLMNWGHDPLKD